MKKNILVTGITGTLGNAVAAAFAQQGHHIIGLSRSLRPTPYELHAIDLSNEEQVSNWIATMRMQSKKIDVAVLTAGGFAAGDLAQTQLKDIREQIQLNFETAFLVAKSLFSDMCSQGSGRIFFISSYAGLDASKGSGAVAYSLSKSLLFHFAELLNASAEQQKVRAHAVAIGTMDTSSNRAAMPLADTTHWISPDRIAERIVQICDRPADPADPTILRW